jgi:hypothetical protein
MDLWFTSYLMTSFNNKVMVEKVKDWLNAWDIGETVGEKKGKKGKWMEN